MSGHRGHVLDALPFLNDLVTPDLGGGALKAAVEHGLTLDEGLVQVSGLTARHDLRRPPGDGLISLDINGAPGDDHRRYRVATNSFLAEGGGGYAVFRQLPVVARDAVLNEILTDHITRAKTISPPRPGRLTDVSTPRNPA
jgi:2',3'-cyclic-nucleotide 2'-phosphodiesterase (5'-nucleotidase family)